MPWYVDCWRVAGLGTTPARGVSGGVPMGRHRRRRRAGTADADSDSDSMELAGCARLAEGTAINQPRALRIAL